MKTYGYLVVALGLAASWLGVVAPALVSAQSDFAVVLGFLATIALFPILWGLYRSWSKTTEAQTIINKIKETTDA